MEKRNYQAKESLDDLETNTSKITANALFNFMQEYSFLEKILLNMAIFPRYYPEDISYLKLKYKSKDLTEWYIPMTCFCDIPLHQISYHAEGNPSSPEDRGYGKFSIAFVLWKDNAFFKRLGKRLDAHVADKLLRDGRVRLKDCKSAKGKTYNATVLLSCEADGRSKFSLEFEGGC